MLRNIGFVVFVILVTWALIVWSSAISAHPGGLAKDGCHRDRAAGERHWHLDGGAERGGKCVQRDGRTVRIAPEAPKRPALVTIDAEAYAVLIGERDRLREQLDETKRALKAETAMRGDLDRKLKRAERARRDAERAAEAEGRKAVEAREDAAAAEARAAGRGPAVSPRCRRGVRAAVQTSRWSWGGSARESLRKACLDE